ncbi:FecR domain-containing protein [Kerstersia sp.]|uniref:FecR domain-containing protein n=1 Tax=Kerstersia sp. TaxID=1930783 RepID=UPI003F914CEB
MLLPAPRALPEDHEIDHRSLEQAAQWYAVLLADDVSDKERAEWAHWLEAPGHRQAWQKMEAISRRFQPLRACSQPGDVVLAAVHAGKRPEIRRRKLLRGLMLAPGLGLMSWAVWRETPASRVFRAQFCDYHTGKGEIKEIALADGTRVWLNTATLLDVDYTPSLRRLVLREGEIFIQTASDSRPLVVDTDHGRLRALGTRFIVRQEAAQTVLAVYEGAVEIRTAGNAARRVVAAGEQTWFDQRHIAAVAPLDAARQGWKSGIFQAASISLRELLDELQRYHSVYFSVSPAIANLRVMGTFPLADLDASLALLRAALPIKVRHTLPWWVSLQAV